MRDENVTPFLWGMATGFVLTVVIASCIGGGVAKEEYQNFGKLCVEQNRLSSLTCVKLGTGEIERLKAIRMLAIGEEVEKK